MNPFNDKINKAVAEAAKKVMEQSMAEEAEQIDEGPRSDLRRKLTRVGNKMDKATGKQRKKGWPFSKGNAAEKLAGVTRKTKMTDDEIQQHLGIAKKLKKEEFELNEAFVIHKGKHAPGRQSSLEGTHHGVTVKPVYTDKKEAQAHADKINAGRGYSPEDHKNPLFGGVLYQVSPAKQMSEEVEQVQEVIGTTTGYSDSGPKVDAATRKAHQERNVVTKGPRAGKITKKAQGKVKDEIMRRNSHIYKFARFDKKMDDKMSEEAEQIDELKKSTLASYIPKASKERGWAGIAAGGASEKSKEQKNQLRFMGKRQKGIERATARLAKEDAEQVAERLIGKQHKIDANKNGKIDAHDFKLLRSKTKKAKMNESYVLMEETTPALSASMKAILADAFHMYFKAHTFHWNVEGANFPEYHKFFGDIYEQLFDTIDPIAEEIRALGDYAPKSLDELKASTSISTESADTPAAMFSALIADNNKIISGLTSGYKIAEAAGEIGLSNFLQDKIDAHKKLGWMIKSTSKGV